MKEFNSFVKEPLWKASYNLSRTLVKLFKDDRGLVNYLIQDIPSIAARIIMNGEDKSEPLLEQLEEFCRQVECRLNQFEELNPEIPLFRAWFRLGQLRTEMYTLRYTEENVILEETKEFIAVAG